MSVARPVVTVYSTAGEPSSTTVPLPGVFTTPLRPDLTASIHALLNMNNRQAYAVSRDAGMQSSAESWGTGRAVSRIPRVPGGGTHRSGQGAFGNMCRGGRMFAPNRVWRKWHRKAPVAQRRAAVASALAASGVVPLIMARGHRVEDVAEVPVVVSSAAQKTVKTAAVLEILNKLGLGKDLERARTSKKTRTGKGKMRNRRYVLRRGPLVVYDADEGIKRACANLPGVETCRVDGLNLLQLAPGGHSGRLIVWTEDAFNKLDTIYGVEADAPGKSKFSLPTPMMSNPDISRIINSDEVQSVLRPARGQPQKIPMKKNPLKNKKVMLALNPAAVIAKQEPAGGKKKKGKKDAKVKAVGKSFYKQMVAKD